MALYDGEHDLYVFSSFPSNMVVEEESLLSSYRDVTSGESDLQTKIVILIHIDKVGRTMRLERWEVITSTHPHRPNVSYSPTPDVSRLYYCTKEFPTMGHLWSSLWQIFLANIFWSSLWQIFFDVVPPNIGAGAFDITPLELQTWNDLYWRMV